MFMWREINANFVTALITVDDMVQLLEEFKFSFGFVNHIYFFDANNLKYTGLKKLPSQSIFHYNKD